MGLDHTEAGALVTAKWNLATDIQEVIKAHHDEGAGPSSRAVAVVRLADAVAHEMGVGYLPGRAPAASILPADLTALSLGNEGWSTLRDVVAARMDEAIAALAGLGG
jgi:HD-like signal output (HDOD) protein